MSTITLEEAIKLAQKAHEGQWRKGQWDSVSASGYAREIAKHSKQSFIARDGNHIQNETDCTVYISKPYITHPLAVMEMMSTEKEKIVAVLHNAIKDTKAELFMEYGKCYFLFNETQYRISIFEHEALQSLTKFKNESYTNYIKQISQNKLATKVKLADIFHNLLDNPSEHTKQKYLKAIPILLQSI